MRKLLSKTLRMFLVLVLTIGLFTGCKSKTESPKEETQSTETTQTEASGESQSAGQAEAQEDYSSKILTYGLTSTWESLNPYVTTSAYAALVQDKIYDKLFFINKGGESISPRNASSWDIDGNTVTLHLNTAAKWHDGTAVTADDWLFTFQLLTNADVSFISRSSLNVIEGTDDTGVAASADALGIKAADAATLVITFKTAYTDESFKDMVVNNFKQLAVLPKHILGEISPAEVFDNAYFTAPIGSGPCIYESEVINSTLTLNTNQDYYLGAPKFGKLVMMVVSPANVVTSVEAGELDYSFAFLSVDNYQIAVDDGLQVTVSENADKINMLMINNNTITDSKIRQAIQYAINKQAMVDNVLLGKAVAAESFYVPESPYLNTELPAGRDVEKAKALLAEAGYTAGTTYKLEIPSGYRTQLANMIQQDLAEVGITIEIVNADASTMMADAEAGNCDMMIMADVVTNSVTAGEWYYSTDNYFCHISDKTFSEKMDAIKAATDDTRLKELTKEYQEYCFEQSPLIPLFHQYNFALTSERLTNIVPFDTQMFNDAIWNWTVN